MTGGGFAGLPVCDEDFVGPLGLFDDRVLLVAALLAVVGRPGLAVVPASRRRPCDKLEPSTLVGDQAGSGEGVVLVLGDEVEGQHGHLAGGRHDRGLKSASSLDALVERPQGSGCATG